ncbi:MAG: CHAT domain-containing protein, partial [Pseudomonadota bacterium]
VDGRERVKADYDLFGAYIAAEDFEGARWCLDDLQRSFAPRSVAKDDGAVLEDSSLLATLGTYLSLKTAEERNVLERKARELDEIFAKLMQFRATHPFDERGSGLARYPRELAIFGTLVEVQTELFGEVGAISAIERISIHHTLSALSRRMGVKPCSLAEVREELLLDSDHGVLFLQRAPIQTGGCRLFAFDQERIRWAAIGSLDEYLKSIRRLIEQLHSPRNLTDQWERLSQESVERLLPPQIRELFDDWRFVTLVGFDDELWFPFECLVVDGSILGTTKAVDHLPSLPLGVHLARRRAATKRHFDKDLLLVVAPEHSEAACAAYPDLEPLLITEDQIHTLTAPFPPDSVHILARKQATFEALMELDGTFSLLHIFAHGVAGDPLDGSFAGILLGSRTQDKTGVLDRKNVAELPKASAVFLSACSAGQDVIRTMEGGLNNLGGAFLEHGADAVVFSHEDLLAGQTIDLMGLVSGEVARGSSLAAALTSARQELVRRGVTDPRLHSTLRVWGLGQQSAFASPRTRLSGSQDHFGSIESDRGPGIRIGLTVMIFSLVALFFWRRRRSAF